jgi:hypothetical protein
MIFFTARPLKIIGPIAISSLLAGAPIGVALSLLGGFLETANYSFVYWISKLGVGLLVGPFFVFAAGMILVAPALTVLRHFGLGGPFFVYAICACFSAVCLYDDVRLGILASALSLPSSLVFCRLSYSKSNGS